MATMSGKEVQELVDNATKYISQLREIAEMVNITEYKIKKECTNDIEIMTYRAAAYKVIKKIIKGENNVEN